VCNMLFTIIGDILLTLFNWSEKLRVVVTDGITIGHPSCCVPHCPNALAKNQDRFCAVHSALAEICAIIGCGHKVEAGFRTCKLSLHREMEEKRNMSNKAFFQLRDRLARQKVSHPNDVFQAAATDDVIEEEHILAETEADPTCKEKDLDGKRRIRAQFGRQRSHNEQILVRPCGIVVARKTFFGSETTPQTIVFLTCSFNELSLTLIVAGLPGKNIPNSRVYARNSNLRSWMSSLSTSQQSRK